MPNTPRSNTPRSNTPRSNTPTSYKFPTPPYYKGTQSDEENCARDFSTLEMLRTSIRDEERNEGDDPHGRKSQRTVGGCYDGGFSEDSSLDNDDGPKDLDGTQDLNKSLSDMEEATGNAKKTLRSLRRVKALNAESEILLDFNTPPNTDQARKEIEKALINAKRLENEYGGSPKEDYDTPETTDLTVKEFQIALEKMRAEERSQRRK